MFRRVGVRLHGLHTLIKAVEEHRVVFVPDDIFKICALIKKEDVLELSKEPLFLASLSRSYYSLEGAGTNPFQKSLIESTLPRVAGTDPSDATAAVPVGSSSMRGRGDPRSATTPTSSIDPSASQVVAAREYLNELWRIARSPHDPSHDARDEGAGTEEEEQAVREVALADQETIHTCVRALETLARFFSPQETASLIKCLTKLGYQNHADLVWITRRATEVGASLAPSEACHVLLSLRHLGSTDSLTAINHRIAANAEALTFVDVLHVLQAFELETHTSPSTLHSLQRVVRRAVGMVEQSTTTRYHTLLLRSCARYSIHQPTVVVPVLMDVVRRFRRTVPEADLLPLLFTTCDMYLVGDRAIQHNAALQQRVTAILTAFTERLEELIPYMDAQRFDHIIDTLSLLPLDVTRAMQLLFQRLEQDSGLLPPPRLARCIQLLSSYPPAKGHPCVVALAFAVTARVEIFDRALLEGVVLSLAQQGFFTETFCNRLGLLGPGGRFEEVDALFALSSVAI
ncbi:hypothetical protein STCU_07472, partial [Strigomonas culicis]